MPERRSPKHRRSPLPRSCRKAPKPARTVPRCASEPVLQPLAFVPRDDAIISNGGDSSSSLLLARPHTWSDVFSSALFPRSPSPSPSPRPSTVDEAKVVVSVAVEGSPGPVRAMMHLGTTVEEAIGVIVDKYSKEGRTPKLDPMAVASFQLHISHFSLQSLNKSDKIGEAGGRSFYLRKSSEVSGSSTGDVASVTATQGSDFDLLNTSSRTLFPWQLLFSYFTKRFKKIERRTKKLWKVVICLACG